MQCGLVNQLYFARSQKESANDFSKVNKHMHIQGGTDGANKQELVFGMVSLSSACFSRNCIFLSWKIFFFSVCGLKFPWKPLHQKPEEERKDSEYFLHFDRNNFPEDWTMVYYVELKNKEIPFSWNLLITR